MTSIAWKEGFQTLTSDSTPNLNSFSDSVIAGKDSPYEPPFGRNLPLDWGEDQWKLYHAFKHDLRVPATPILKKIGVRYEVYSTWMESLTNHVSIHTGFYPEGKGKYLDYCFLFKTSHKNTISSLFSSLPAASFIMEVGDCLFVSVSILPHATRDLYCLIFHMKEHL